MIMLLVNSVQMGDILPRCDECPVRGSTDRFSQMLLSISDNAQGGTKFQRKCRSAS